MGILSLLPTYFTDSSSIIIGSHHHIMKYLSSHQTTGMTLEISGSSLLRPNSEKNDIGPTPL
jgi:hypothetical protein